MWAKQKFSLLREQSCWGEGAEMPEEMPRLSCFL